MSFADENRIGQDRWLQRRRVARRRPPSSGGCPRRVLFPRMVFANAGYPIPGGAPTSRSRLRPGSQHLASRLPPRSAPSTHAIIEEADPVPARGARGERRPVSARPSVQTRWKLAVDTSAIHNQVPIRTGLAAWLDLRAQLTTGVHWFGPSPICRERDWEAVVSLHILRAFF